MIDLLELKFYSDDLNEELTIREFMQRLLITLFDEMEGFSGKRPFGNSSWDDDLIKCLVRNHIIIGEIDEDGYLDGYDGKAYDNVIKQIIKSL